MTAVTGLGMSDLLERAGFRLRGKNRADCTHCEGHSVGTVSFTDEVAHCFRCQWKANTFTLAKELGIRDGVKLNREDTQQLVHRAIVERFFQWRDELAWRLIHRLWRLRQRTATATEVLNAYTDCNADYDPDCASAWDALTRAATEENEINLQLDWLLCVKDGPFLENPSTIGEVFDWWKGINERRSR